MNYIDYILIAFLIVGFVLGFRDGLVRKVIGIIGLVLGIILSYRFAEDGGKFISPFLNNEVYLAEIVAGILIFIITVLVFSIIKRIVHPLDKVNRFVNQLIGGLAGTIQIIFFMSAFLLVLKIFNFPSNEVRNNSIFYTRIYNIIPNTIDFVVGGDSDVMDWFKKFINNDRSLPDEIENTGI